MTVCTSQFGRQHHIGLIRSTSTVRVIKVKHASQNKKNCITLLEHCIESTLTSWLFTQGVEVVYRKMFYQLRELMQLCRVSIVQLCCVLFGAAKTDTIYNFLSTSANAAIAECQGYWKLHKILLIQSRFSLLVTPNTYQNATSI